MNRLFTVEKYHRLALYLNDNKSKIMVHDLKDLNLDLKYFSNSYSRVLDLSDDELVVEYHLMRCLHHKILNNDRRKITFSHEDPVIFRLPRPWPVGFQYEGVFDLIQSLGTFLIDHNASNTI